MNEQQRDDLVQGAYRDALRIAEDMGLYESYPTLRRSFCEKFAMDWVDYRQPQPHVVETVEELEALPVGTVIGSRLAGGEWSVATKNAMEDGWEDFDWTIDGHAGKCSRQGVVERMGFPLVVLTPATQPTASEAWERGRHDWARYVQRCEDAEAAGQGVMIPDPVNPFGPATDQEFPDTQTVVDAVRYFAESWRFKGEPDDMPDEHEEALDWCASTLFAMLARLAEDAPLGAECKNTGWLITAATCPHCKGSGRADSIQGAAECQWCGGCGHVCDDSATRPTASEPTGAQGEDR